MSDLVKFHVFDIAVDGKAFSDLFFTYFFFISYAISNQLS